MDVIMPLEFEFRRGAGAGGSGWEWNEVEVEVEAGLMVDQHNACANQRNFVLNYCFSQNSW